MMGSANEAVAVTELEKGKTEEISEKGLRAPKNPAEKLLLNMRVTSNCRYRAAIRLGMKNDISFVATTVLSLGLILIPLLQNAGVNTAFSPSVSNGMQLFFAVCVLVYSVTISKAGYGVRSEKLNRCGDDLKTLARDLDMQIKSGEASKINVVDFGSRYSIIVSGSENHDDNDYLISRLHMSRDYQIKGLKRFYYEIKSRVVLYSMYAPPAFVMGLELIFLSDFIGATHIYPESFRSVAK